MELKIRINEKETFSIELGEELNQNQFKGLLLRLNKISKIMDTDIILGGSPSHSPGVTPAVSCPNEEGLPELLTAGKFVDREQAERFLDMCQNERPKLIEIYKDKQRISSVQFNLKKRFGL